MLKTEKKNKPKLNRHVKAHIKQIKHIKQELKQVENKDKLEPLPPNKRLFSLILTIHFSQSSHNQTKIS